MRLLLALSFFALLLLLLLCFNCKLLSLADSFFVAVVVLVLFVFVLWPQNWPLHLCQCRCHCLCRALANSRHVVPTALILRLSGATVLSPSLSLSLFLGQYCTLITRCCALCGLTAPPPLRICCGSLALCECCDNSLWNAVNMHMLERDKELIYTGDILLYINT